MEEKEYTYMVGIISITFNQSKFILDTLNGFVMQQTNFPFVAMVIDDASTDGEQEVIKKFVTEQFDTTDTSIAYEKETDYAHITYARHKTNKNCYMAVLYLKENHYSQRKPKRPYLAEWRDHVKYETLCEGDDYWIDAQKLQKQVDFLEEHEEYSMCFHGAEIKVTEGINPQKNRRINLYKNLEIREYTGPEILRHWTIPTASVVHRREINIKTDNRFVFGDIILFLSCAECGRIYCIDNNNMSVYRILPDSVTYRKRPIEKMINHYKAIEEKFSNKGVKKEARILVSKYYINWFLSCYKNKQSFEVIRRIISEDRRYAIHFFLLLPKRVLEILNYKIKKIFA